MFGYEILFRDGVEDYFRSTDPEAASRSTLDTSLLMGLDVLSDGRRAFINCTRDMLLKDYMTLLPSSQAVVEILETVEPDDLVMAACQRLKAAGYMIALDDFVRKRSSPAVDRLRRHPESRCAQHNSRTARRAWSNATVHGNAVCWPRKLKLAKNSWPQKKPASFISRAIFSAALKP